jgi:manganese/zinc/iron transport system permease protein
LLVRWLEQRRVGHRVARQHLLRALYEWCETGSPGKRSDPVNLLEQPVSLAELRHTNDWSETRMQRLLRLGFAEKLITWNNTHDAVHLTAEGKLEARRVTRNHRLWETYLLHYADVAPQHIHHNADQIEHVIEPHIVNELEELLASREGGTLVPADPEKPQVITGEVVI